MKNRISFSDITPEELYKSRRRFIKNVFTATSASVLAASCQTKNGTEEQPIPATATGEPEKTYTDDRGFTATSYEDITGYTNYYEFSTNKSEPTRLAEGFITSPWKVRVDGYVNNPREFDIDEFRLVRFCKFKDRYSLL